MSTENLIYNTARADGMPEVLSALLVAQAKHETGNFTHRFFTKGKNAFGYSYVSGAKWQLPDPGGIADNGAGIAQYASIQNSVHEITDWIKRRQKEGRFPADLREITTPDQYAALLKKLNYYGAPESLYRDALRRWYESLTLTDGVTMLSVVVVVALMVYGLKKS